MTLSSIPNTVPITQGQIYSSKSPDLNRGSLAESITGVSATPLRSPDFYAVDSEGVISFSQKSASGEPLAEANLTRNMVALGNYLRSNGHKVNTFDTKTLSQMAHTGDDKSFGGKVLQVAPNVALSFFNLLPAHEKNDSRLMMQAVKFYNMMDKLSQTPDSSTQNKEACEVMDKFIDTILSKLNLSNGNIKLENKLGDLARVYLNKFVYPDIITKLASVLSSERLEELRNNPEKVLEHLDIKFNSQNESMIEALLADIPKNSSVEDKLLHLSLILKALDQKTEIIANLIQENSAAQSTAAAPADGNNAANPDAAQPAPADGISANPDAAQPAPADGNNAANPRPLAPNITNITTTNNYYYGSPSSTPNHTFTTTINLSDTKATTKPENNRPQSATASQTTADEVDSSTQSFDDVDSTPARPATDNLNPAASANTSATHKSLNSSGTLFGTKGPAPSWLDKGSKVTLTNDGQVRDLSQKQSYGQDGVEQKKPTSLNSFGNQFVGFGQQNPAPAPLRGAGKTQQDAPQVSDTPDLSAAKDIPVSDNTLKSEDISGKAGETKQMPPAKLVTAKSLNAQGTLLGTDGSVPSQLHTNADVITTSGGQVFELAEKQRYAQGNVEVKQPNAVNQFGTAFQGMRPQSSAPTALRDTANTEQASQDAAPVSYKADLLIPGKKPNFISTLDLQVNSDGTLQPTDETYRATPAQVVVEKQLNAQGTLFGMKVGATSASTPSELTNNDSAVTLTQQGAQTRELSSKLAYRLGGTQPKSSSSVNAQGNQFVGFGKNSTAPTQSWLYNKGANVVLTQEGAQTRAITEKDQYRADKFTPGHSPTNPSEAK